MGAPQVVAYPSEGVGEPLPMEPDPEAEEDNEDSGVSLSLPFSILPVLSSASFSTKFYGWQRGDPQCHPLGGPRICVSALDCCSLNQTLQVLLGHHTSDDSREFWGPHTCVFDFGRA